MRKVILDQATKAKLFDLAEMLEFCDEDGQTIGYYSPAVSQDKSIYEDLEVPFTEEEAQRLLKQPPGRPLRDILKDLEKGA